MSMYCKLLPVLGASKLVYKVFGTKRLLNSHYQARPITGHPLFFVKCLIFSIYVCANHCECMRIIACRPKPAYDNLAISSFFHII